MLWQVTDAPGIYRKDDNTVGAAWWSDF